MSKNILFYISALLLLGLNFWFIQETCYFFTYSREQIIHRYLQDYPNIYKPLVFKEFYFTHSAYKQSLWFSSLGVCLSFVLNVLYWRYKTFCKNLYQKAIEVCLSHFYQFKTHILSLSSKQIIALLFTLLSVLGHQIYMYKQVFVAMDETFSWLFFASQGTFVTLSNYPVPNNHIFYNLCSLFWSNFISDQILAMRLTSLLSFWALLLLIFYFFLKTTNFQTALFSLMLIGLGFSQAIFAVQGRGYMLLALWFFLALWSTQAYLSSQREGYLLIFVKACVLGFWTIPVFLYIFLSLYAYLLFITWWKEKKRYLFLIFFRAGLLIGAIVYLCYSPVLLYSGFSALAGNENVSPKTYDSAWFFGYILSISLRESIIYVISLPKYVSFMTFSILGLLLLYVSRKQKDASFQYLWSFLCISLPITFFIICLMQAFPFYRVWTYYAIFLAIFASFLAYYFIFSRREIAYAYLFGINILLMIGTHFQFEREIQDFYDPKSYKHHKGLEEATQEITAKEQTIYLTTEAFYIRFWLEYTQKTHFIRQSPCKSDIAITESSEVVPLCQEVEKEIWFLRFHHYKEQN